jgi:hypothetical protein
MALSEFPSVPVLFGMSWLLVAGVTAAGVMSIPMSIFMRTYLATHYRTSGCTGPSASAADVGCSPVLTSQTDAGEGLGPQQRYVTAGAGAW